MCGCHKLDHNTCACAHWICMWQCLCSNPRGKHSCICGWFCESPRGKIQNIPLLSPLDKYKPTSERSDLHSLEPFRPRPRQRRGTIHDTTRRRLESRHGDRFLVRDVEFRRAPSVVEPQGGDMGHSHNVPGKVPFPCCPLPSLHLLRCC